MIDMPQEVVLSNLPNEMLLKLNGNRITEDKKEAVITMGLGICQVRCISHGCNGHYHKKH